MTPTIVINGKMMEDPFDYEAIKTAIEQEIRIKTDGASNKSKPQGFLLYIAWVVSLIAMFGSLYFSEMKGYIPCELCWYQRIFMYPLTLILGIGTFQNDSSVKKFVLPLSLIGGIISLMHY